MNLVLVDPDQYNTNVEDFDLVSKKKKKKKSGCSMEVALEFLNSYDLYYAVITEYHVKIGEDLNFYPSKGTVNKDGFPRFKGKGLDFLKRLLLKEGRISE